MSTEQQIPKLAGTIVEHQSGFAALSTDDAQWVIGETKKAVALFCEVVKKRTEVAANNLLEFVTTVPLPPIKLFRADDHFKNGETVDGVKCLLGDNFKKRFGGKIEEDVAGCDIRIRKLLRASRDAPILVELGEERYETSLTNFWHFLKLWSHKGGWFVFYIRDIEGILWAVRACWNGDGWLVGARSVECRGRWRADDGVCSR